MASLSVLYSRALHLSPMAAHLSLGQLRRSPDFPRDLHVALFQVLLLQSGGTTRASSEVCIEFQRGIEKGPPPGTEAGPTNEALEFVFQCCAYGDGHAGEVA